MSRRHQGNTLEATAQGGLKINHEGVAKVLRAASV